MASSPATTEDGARAPVVSQFVLKVHSRCDLACDHCYVYEHADQSWRYKPRSMSHTTASRAARRIAEHARRHSLTDTQVIVHGGEPLLLGLDAMDRILATLRSEIDAATRLDLRIHTNAVRLSESFCAVFQKHGTRVGVSLDGDRTGNDRHRLYANGSSSHRQTLLGISLLRRVEYYGIYAGILCTIDIRNDPIKTYEALIEQRPPRVDFLLPHATWERPPPRSGNSPTEYANWLVAIYERWEADGRPTSIRIFEALEATAAGRPSGFEGIGTDSVDLIVIESDGTYEQVDTLKTAYEGAPLTGYNVFEHSIDQAASHPGLMARRTGVDGLCATCKGCPVVHRCGGGMYTHRYRPDNGFDNPSVYCEDLKELIQRIPPNMPGAPDQARSASAGAARELPPLLEALAHVPGSVAPVRLLAQAGRSDDRALLAAAARRLGPVDPPVGAWEVLAALDQSEPSAVATVLKHPYVRAWAAQVLGDMTAPGSATPQEQQRDYLSSLALSAAIRAGADATVEIRPQGGAIHLPTLGTLLLDGPERITLTATGGCLDFTVDGRRRQIELLTSAGQGAAPQWLPLHRLRASGVDIVIEDRDEYRHCYEHVAGPRLSGEEAALWQRRFADAMAFLSDRLPGYVAGLREGLCCITPLRQRRAGDFGSATARYAPGAIGVALPEEPEMLALMIMHEFQHVKLWSALGLYELVDERAEGLYRVGWRDDERPAEGVLHGVYAHVAVADFWKAQRDRPEYAYTAQAATRHDHWSEAVDAGIETLLASRALSPLGELFVRRVAQLRA